VVATFDEMRPEHLNQVVEIEKASFPTPWSHSAFTYEILQNSFAHYIVAMADNQVVGYGGMWCVLDEAHITNVAVRTDCRMKGVGRAIMMEIIRRAVLMGISSITLEVRPSNTAARKLYTALGFKERGKRKRYYTDTGEDAIIMWKERLVEGCLPDPAGRECMK